MDSHYAGLFAAYSTVAAIVWGLVLTIKPKTLEHPWPHYPHPWRDLGIFLAAIAAVLAIGQLYTRGMLLPERDIARKALNQILIFAPVLVFVAWKRSAAVAFLPLRAAPINFGLGLVLAACAVAVYGIARGRADEIGTVFAFLIDHWHIPLLAQVLLEDIAIAILLGLAVAVIGTRGAVVATALLFAAAHLPALLASGAAAASLSPLLLDTVLGVIMLGAVLRTRSIWWYWPVHSILDLLQFYKPG